jgi:hypothetical protein
MLIQNITDNTIKAYTAKELQLNAPIPLDQRVLNVSIKLINTSNGPHAELVFGDRAIGYSDRIINEGFPRGFSDFAQTHQLEGNGLGMHRMTNELVKGYTLIEPSNSNEGAITTVTIPTEATFNKLSQSHT